MSAVKPNLNTNPVARKWTILTSFSVAVDLTAHASGDTHPARALIVLSGGVVSVIKPDDGIETTPTLAPGTQLPVQVKTIRASGDGTTATSILVLW